MMRVVTETVGPLAMNCYLVADEACGSCAVIDPGDEIPKILNRLHREGWRPVILLATHGHLDHVGGVQQLKDAAAVPFQAHPKDQFWLEALPYQAGMLGLPAPAVPVIDAPLADGQIIPVGSLRLEVRHTPGHTPGGCSFVAPGAVFTGDALFAGSIGRTDFPRSSFSALIGSVREKLLTLPDDTVVYPGHGPATTIGAERTTNPFFQEATAQPPWIRELFVEAGR